jgi:hypothetical protein
MKEHFCWATYQDYGLLAYLNNNLDKSLEILSKLVDQAEKTGKLDKINYMDLGSVCSEAMLYEKAVQYLTEAIKRDPNNKAAYFERAAAYFEMGAFDLALEDFIASNYSLENIQTYKETSIAFREAFLNHLAYGATEALNDFVPSLCNTAYGINEAIWAFHPANPEADANGEAFVNASYEMVACLADYCKNMDWNTLEGYVEQMRILFERFEQLTDSEKGELIGYVIGRYGIEILGGYGIVKAATVFRDLKFINRIRNLEAMSVSQVNKERVISDALRHAAQREAYFKNVKYNFDAHNKHIFGHNDYDGLRSIWDHPDPEGLFRKFAGKGHPERGTPGSPAYKETVNFGEYIGTWISEDGKQRLPTTRGAIHYGNKGGHIVPIQPVENLKK